MKIKTRALPYSAVLALPRPQRKKTLRPSLFFRTLVRLAAEGDLRDARFTCTKEDLSAAGDGPYLILMNHSSFIDLEIVSKLMYPKPYCIVCTSDGFVGKPWLMRHIGCIPTKKFVTDVSLIGDMRYALKELKTSVLLYPEASYSFDGRATPLPRRLGVLLRRLDVPVLCITTQGAFTRDPLYNCLQKRKVAVSAHLRCLFTREDLHEKTIGELNDALDAAFSFDNFAWQRQNGVRVTEPFRADGLDRILYKCPACGAEGETVGEGIALTCRSCGRRWELDELGVLRADEGETEFSSVPEWYEWERSEVRRELQDGAYRLDTAVDIAVMADYRAIYRVGTGRLIHDGTGFTLTGDDGLLSYTQSPLASYSLYADYYWYELGDVICIGGDDLLYYCFPKQRNVAAKTRLAAEELYKMRKRRRDYVPPAAQEAELPAD